MPAQTTTSNLFARLTQRAAQAHEQHKHDEPQIGNAGLPAGIEGGVAELREIKLGEYQSGELKGELYFLAAGVVKHPREVNGTPVEGLRTQIGPEPLCDTPTAKGDRKKLADHYAWVLNQVRILGVDTKDTKIQDLERVFTALRQAKPHFRFRTWQGAPVNVIPANGRWQAVRRGDVLGTFPTEQAARAAYPWADRESRVNHEWNGACSWTDPETSPVEDRLAPSGNGQEPVRNRQEAAPEVEEPAAGFSEFNDLEALGQAADNGDEAAVRQIADRALAAGWSEDELTNAESWLSVAQALAGSGNPVRTEGGEESGEAEAEEPPEPAKGETWLYRPLVTDPKTRRQTKSRKLVEVEITASNPKTRTASVRDPVAKTLYKGVAWDDLTPLS